MGLLENLAKDTNYGKTENGAIKHTSTLSKVLDMFGMCGSYRNRTDEECIKAFSDAFCEDKDLALKCLFYLRDCRGGQGERRFFRVCFKYLCQAYPDVALRNLKYVSEFGRWDDLVYTTADTELWDDAIKLVKDQLEKDIDAKHPSLLGKWLPSENASSKATKTLASKIRHSLGMTSKEYRKMLSQLRYKINIVEGLMSEGKWDEIEFDKLPSKAGLIYANAFIRNCVDYIDFIKNKETKVNAEVIDPVNIATKVFKMSRYRADNPDVAVLQKYWDNLKDYYNGREENGIAVVDVSGSMYGTPLAAAVGMGAYIAERGHGPFANHFITFSRDPELVSFTGANICEKMLFCENSHWGMNTDIEKVMDLLLNTLVENHSPDSDVPDRLYIFSDMEFDEGICNLYRGEKKETLFEKIEKKWREAGYEMPQIVFWNLDARTQNVPAMGEKFSYISGFSMNMIEAVLSGKTGYDLMLEKLLSDRYKDIKAEV